MRHLTGFRVALCATLVAAVAGCGPAEQASNEGPASVRLYGADGNMSNAFGALNKDQPGILSGMKGTAPLVPLTDDFKQRLHGVDPGLKDYSYAGETYDAIVIVALAAQLARTTDPNVVKDYINGVTNFGQVCTTVGECLKLARQGKDIQYQGITVHSGFTEVGEPSTTTYGTLHFGGNNQIADVLTEYVGAGNASAAAAKGGPAPVKTSVKATGAPLIIGDLTSHTGNNSASNPPLMAAAHLALKEINEEEGVLGKPVQWLDGDDKTDIEAAKTQLDKHIRDGAQVVLGPSTSRVTVGVMEQIAEGKVIAISPSATSAQLSSVDDNGFFFRSAPSDVLQGKALADVILRDGTQRVSIIASKGAYGEGLQLNVRDELVKAGLSADQIQLLTYEPPAKDSDKLVVTDQVNQIKQFAPVGVVIVGLDESAQVIAQLAEAGLDPRKATGA